MSQTCARWIAASLFLGLLVGTSGCALSSSKTTATKAPLTQEQADWWAANQSRKQYVAGKGYVVEGTSGFFDHEGRKITGDNSYADQEAVGYLERMAPKKAIASFKKAIGRGPNEKNARKEMEEGDALFRQKQYVKAAEHYGKAYKGWPDSPLEEEAMFKAAESEFFADRYSKADDAYALLVKKYASTQYLPQVVVRRFAIGRYWEQHDQAHPHWAITPNLTDKTRPIFDTGGHALRVYEGIRLADPTGAMADDSVMAAANAHFIKGHWESADYHYGLLRSEYPKSEHQYQAHLLGLRCKLLRYQGPGYEGAALDEAEELATQLLTQFSHELGGEREKLVQVRAGIRSQRALREYDMAEYYARGKYYGAAKIYYARIAKEYPDTQLAQECRSKLELYKTEPNKPTEPFEWLVELFPQSKREGPLLPKGVAPASVPTAPATDTVASPPPSTTTR